MKALRIRSAGAGRPRPVDLSGWSIAGNRRVHERGPRIDSAGQVVEIGEPLRAKILRRVLAPDPVVTLEHDRRVALALEQRVVIRLVQEPRARDRGDGPLLIG